jgi:hypothetical protein
MMLNEQSIEESLKAVIEHSEQGALDQATRQLDVLNFVSLQKRTPDPTKRFGRSGHRKSSVAGEAFGMERVNATARHIAECRDALSGGDQKRALDAAGKALKCWQSLSRKGSDAAPKY